MPRFTTIALVLGMALQGPTAWSVAYACQMTGEVSDSCCCKTDTSDASSVIEAANPCCDVTASESRASSLSPTVPNRTEIQPPLGLVAYVPILPECTTNNPEWDITVVTSDPPPRTYLLNQSFRC